MALPLSTLQEAGRGPGKCITSSHSGPAAFTEVPKFARSSGAFSPCSCSDRAALWAGTRGSSDLWQLFHFLVACPQIRQAVLLRHSGCYHLLQARLSDFSPLRNGVVPCEEADCNPTWLSLMLSMGPDSWVSLLVYKAGWGEGGNREGKWHWWSIYSVPDTWHENSPSIPWGREWCPHFTDGEKLFKVTKELLVAPSPDSESACTFQCWCSFWYIRVSQTFTRNEVTAWRACETQVVGLHLWSFSFRRTKVGPENFHFYKFSGDAETAGLGTTLRRPLQQKALLSSPASKSSQPRKSHELWRKGITSRCCMTDTHTRDKVVIQRDCTVTVPKCDCPTRAGACTPCLRQPAYTNTDLSFQLHLVSCPLATWAGL